jgi:hypothetical protein
MENDMEYPNLTEMEKRSKRYWTVDGIPEMLMGALWIVWGAGFLVQDAIPKGSRLSHLYGWIILTLLVVSGLTANWIIKILKNKYTFPRGGYVKFSDPPKSQRWIAAVAAGLVGAAISLFYILAARGRFDANAFAPAFGLTMAIGFFFGSRKPGMRHFLWFSLISLVLGVALYPLKLGWNALPWLFIGLGVPFIVAGFCRLRAYVRSVPIQGGEEL